MEIIEYLRENYSSFWSRNNLFLDLSVSTALSGAPHFYTSLVCLAFFLICSQYFSSAILLHEKMHVSL